MPQLDPYWIASQVFWLFIAFGFLYFVMVRAGLPRLGEVLQDRRERIADDIESAELANKESEAIDQENQQQIRTARLRAMEVVAEIQKESDVVAAARNAELDKMLQVKMAEAQVSIDKAKKDVLERVVPLSVELTETVLKHVAGLTISRDKIEKIVAAKLGASHV